MRGPVFACAIIPRIAFITDCCRVLLLPLQKVTKQIPIEHLIPIFHMAAQGQIAEAAGRRRIASVMSFEPGVFRQFL